MRDGRRLRQRRRRSRRVPLFCVEQGPYSSAIMELASDLPGRGNRQRLSESMAKTYPSLTTIAKRRHRHPLVKELERFFGLTAPTSQGLTGEENPLRHLYAKERGRGSRTGVQLPRMRTRERPERRVSSRAEKAGGAGCCCQPSTRTAGLSVWLEPRWSARRLQRLLDDIDAGRRRPDCGLDEGRARADPFPLRLCEARRPVRRQGGQHRVCLGDYSPSTPRPAWDD